MDAEIRSRCESVRRLNEPVGFTYKLWSEPEIMALYGQDPYVRYLLAAKEKAAFVVDRLRVLLLRDRGGIYVDADCKAIRPFTIIGHWLDFPHVQFLTGVRNPYRPGVQLWRGLVAFIDNTVFATSPNGTTIRNLCALYRPECKKVVGADMGRRGLGLGLDGGTVLLGYEYFYVHQEETTANTILLHDFEDASGKAMNLGSWADPKPEPPSLRMLQTS
jgi:hypothetical protein